VLLDFSIENEREGDTGGEHPQERVGGAAALKERAPPVCTSKYWM